MATTLTALTQPSVGASATAAFADTLAANDTILAGAVLGRKNGLINAVGFPVNQRAGASYAATGYTFDRWLFTLGTGATSVITPTTPTPGTVTGFIKQSCVWTRTVAGSTVSTLEQRIESASTYAGQSVTVSVLMSCASGTVDLIPSIVQNVTAPVTTTGATLTATTTPTLYTATITVPSISGKTLNASATDYTSLVLSRPTAGNGPTTALTIYAVQIEQGTGFTGWEVPSQQETLAQCQRFYWRNSANATGTNAVFGTGVGTAATIARIVVRHPVTLRAPATAIETTGTAANYAVNNATNTALSAVPTINTTTSNESATVLTIAVAAGLTTGGYYDLIANTAAAAFIGLTAEL